MRSTLFAPLLSSVLVLAATGCGGKAQSSPPSDAGEVDAGSQIHNSGPFDSGPIDAGPVDAGPVDSGPVDSGPVDSGPVDSGPVDSGPVDSGPVDSGPVDAGPCANADPSWMNCSGTCTDTATDPNNCSTCGMVCPFPVSSPGTSGCAGGACQLDCDAGFSWCNVRCVDETSDPTNCGACGNFCGGGSNCDAGTCTCPSGIFNDNNNCGTCGNVCRYGEVCDSATQRCGCPAGKIDDSNNCGTCGNACQPGNVCSYFAPTGICGCGSAAAYANTNCAACTQACPNNETCNPDAGACACASGMLGDVNNCGRCGTVCGNQNGTGQCVDGGCVETCDTNYAACNNNCVDYATDPANCGGCGEACSTNNIVASCSNIPDAGICNGTCAAGFADCDHNLRSDGCEADIAAGDGLTGSSIANCGACGVACPATANVVAGASNPGLTCAASNCNPATGSCSGGGCALASGGSGCVPGFANCNGAYFDGCEINSNTDNRNCGGCGTVCADLGSGETCNGSGWCTCPAGESLSNGACCVPGTGSCPGAAITLSVAANPNCVLTAEATIAWTGSLVSGTVTFEGDETPSANLSSSVNPITVPVLGLEASTTYHFQVVGTDSAGDTIWSNVVTLTTGALPSGLLVPAAKGTASGNGLTLLALQATFYATIVTGSGIPVWYSYVPQGVAADFQQQPDGTFTISALLGVLPNGGDDVAFQQVDVSGNLLHTWTALGADGGGNIVDTNQNAIHVIGTNDHEFRLQPDAGTAVMFGSIVQPMDLAGGGYNGNPSASVFSEVVEKVNLAGTVIWAWNSAEYFTPADVDPNIESIQGPIVGLSHGNSIDVMDDGNYLVSLRNVDQVVKIDSTTGHVIWRLGGAGNSSTCSQATCGDFAFKNDELNGFSGQHGARELRPDMNGCIAQCPGGEAACPSLCGNIILFDCGNSHAPPQSRAVEYTLDTNAMTATEVWSSIPSTTLFTPVSGFAQRYPNGNTLVSFGENPTAQELDPTGADVVWSASYTGVLTLYRAYRIGSLYSYELPP